MRTPFVVLTGNLAVGKTTFAERLRDRFGWWVGYESVDDNPYLQDFYIDMKQWSFHLQLYFLSHRSLIYQEAAAHQEGAVIDGNIYADRYVFAAHLYKSGHISERDFVVYDQLHQFLVQHLPQPSLVIHVTADVATIRQRLIERGQAFDQDVDGPYLSAIADRFSRTLPMFAHAPVLTLDSTTADFRTSIDEPRLKRVLDQVEAML